LPIKPQKSFTLWNGAGIAKSFFVEIDELQDKVDYGMKMARRKKAERLTTSSAKQILRSLAQRGIAIEEETFDYDEDDVIGLIGEILLTEIVVWFGYEPLFVKWRVSGTSKSRGIDLVSRNSKEPQNLILMEAKHLHSGVKGFEKGTCSSAIRMRFVDGLDEFKHEQVLINLASVIATISSARRIQEAAGDSGASGLDALFTFLLSKLSLETYDLEIHVFIDAKYCVDTTLPDSVHSIANPIEVGNHTIHLMILQTDHLEPVSESICEHYA
jgi:hypothetical protein